MTDQQFEATELKISDELVQITIDAIGGRSKIRASVPDMLNAAFPYLLDQWLDSLLGDIPEEAVGRAGAALREKYKPRLGIVARAVVYRHPSTEQISEDAIRPFLQSLRSSLGDTSGR